MSIECLSLHNVGKMVSFHSSMNFTPKFNWARLIQRFTMIVSTNRVQKGEQFHWWERKQLNQKQLGDKCRCMSKFVSHQPMTYGQGSVQLKLIRSLRLKHLIDKRIQNLSSWNSSYLLLVVKKADPGSSEWIKGKGD